METAIGVFASRDRAEDAVKQLLSQGVPEPCIVFLTPTEDAAQAGKGGVIQCRLFSIDQDTDRLVGRCDRIVGMQRGADQADSQDEQVTGIAQACYRHDCSRG